jgi:hypothetical protein
LASYALWNRSTIRRHTGVNREVGFDHLVRGDQNSCRWSLIFWTVIRRLLALSTCQSPTVGYRRLEWSIVSITMCKSRCLSAGRAAVAPNSSTALRAAAHRFANILSPHKTARG